MATHMCFIEIPQDGMHRLHPHDNRNCNRQQNHRDLSPMSLSSSSSSPRYERNMGFFQQLIRRFGFKSSDDLAHTISSDDSYSTSPDSCSSSTDQVPNMKLSLTASRMLSAQMHTRAGKNELLPHYQSSSSEQLSYASSDSSNSNFDINNELQFQLTNINTTNGDKSSERRLSRISRLHRRSTSSICKVFEVISKSSGRSLSCSGSEISQAKENGFCSDPPPKSALKPTSKPSELRKRSISSAQTTNVKSKPKQQEQPPQRILRQPVSYI